MKKIVLIKTLLLFSLPLHLFSQMKIRDKAITNQQERMVYKQWSKNKFTPSTKVLGIEINPLWYTVWGIHPNYRKKDHRPLGPKGPQTARMGLTTQLKGLSKEYENESDSLRNIILKEYARNSSLTPEPLWELYYKREFRDLLNPDISKYMQGLTPEQQAFLIEVEYWQNHVTKMAELKERLEMGRDEMTDRGNRIIFYHRILIEYRNAESWWASNKLHAPRSLTTKKKLQDKDTANPFGTWTADSDKAIAEKVIRKFRYIN